MATLRPDSVMRSIDRFGSRGLDLGLLARIPGDGLVHLAELAPGGRIGRREAVPAQLLAVIRADGFATGADPTAREITAGDAVSWERGEEHETWTVDGLAAVILEADRLELPG